MVPRKVYELCHQPETVTSELARDPSQCPTKLFHKLFEGHHRPHVHQHSSDSSSDSASENETLDDLQKARACGNFGSAQPSNLFLQIYHDALCSLEKNPTAGVVSPQLMGSTGLIPLTIVAPLPDLCRHLANCIARAEHEVFLGTNFWIYSNASTLVTNAIRELSKRAGEQGRKVVMKMVYDRGDPRQAWENRLSVHEDQYAGGKVKLPPASEIPNVDLQVINFHRPIFGTFHAKFTVIDRRMALLQSSNIQDNDNLEMLAHIEGPIVDSFYDAALLSWGKALEPPLPLLHSPAADAPIPCLAKKTSHEATVDNGAQDLPEHTVKSEHYDLDLEHEATRVNDSVLPRGEETPTQAVSRHLNTTIQPDTTGDAPDTDQDPIFTPYKVLPHHEPVAMALVNREPFGSPNHSNTQTPQNSAWISAINHATSTVLIQTPNMNAEPLLEPLLNAVRRGVIVTCYLCLGYNDAGELLPFQNGTNEMIANRLYSALESDEEKGRLRVHYYVGKDQTMPIHNSFKKRSCHIKLMIVDGRVAIQGNGNLDTQSFFHSQEINVLIDSPVICGAWLELIGSNQNTARYGAASSKDGCWHHPETGEIPPGSIGTDPGRFSWAMGVVGAVQRVRGVGGF
ncbi:hypothetical protein PENANT_c019G08007 [Penicillium antarcticum]|uniref:PLD phosphodiesterase domain-containing protein n=1 Tax=Penicillium antarcticum TaxID=416450 RepID=A0A1V6Q0R2_9EURO|nr:uncharacterized protein N7508_001129 [Penicillium antarcticum]KAJ5316621.1 hypothetical protein N7508_001129 [Penicillium antarcticum]OQD82815.1 hypothetical protein PENANT_c019G08007 [Penicillium antarcticum]